MLAVQMADVDPISNFENPKCGIITSICADLHVVSKKM